MKNMNDIIWLESVDSTNEEARRRISGIDNLSVLSAVSQTAGRGQRGNTWSSNPGENLTFSIVLKYADIVSGGIQANEQFAISELTSLSIVDFLAEKGIQAMVKWPNDIYIGTKKICGILIENSIAGHLMNTSIIGIGLNINQRNFNVTAVEPTSAVLETGREYDITECLDEFMDIFRSNIEKYLHINGGLSDLHMLYMSRLWRKDELHSYHDMKRDIIFNGRIRNVSDQGLLLVENEEGELLEFAFKEIGYII